MKKKYNPNKKVELIDVTNAFIDYVTDMNLTTLEYLIVKHVYDNVITKLGEKEK